PSSTSRAASATPAEELCSLPTSEGPYLFSEATTERNAFSVGQIERDDGRAVIAAAASQGGADQARGHLTKTAALEHEPFEPIVVPMPAYSSELVAVSRICILPRWIAVRSRLPVRESDGSNPNGQLAASCSGWQPWRPAMNSTAASTAIRAATSPALWPPMP